MRTSTIFLLSLLLSTLAIGQETDTRSLSQFDKISVATGIKANIVAGDKNEIKITARGIELEKIESSVEDGQLVVKIKRKWNNWGSPSKSEVKALITYNSELEGIAASSGASIDSDNTIISDHLELDASSGADIDVDVMSQSVAVDVSSGARIETRGKTSTLDVEVSSGSTYKGYDLLSQDAKVDGSSGASAKISVSNSLNVDVSSGASVKYKGDPSIKNIDKSSGGSVKQSTSDL